MPRLREDARAAQWHGLNYSFSVFYVKYATKNEFTVIGEGVRGKERVRYTAHR